MKKIFMLLCATVATAGVTAQELPKELKVSGYVQIQNQWGQEKAPLKVGAANSNPEESFNRFGIRRGRLKFAYTTGLASAVFQLDMTEKGIGFKDAYLNVKDPWTGSMAFKGGVFDRPFGYEISYSSSTRESPERSTVFQTLFPDERDLGAMLTLAAPKTSPLSILKLEAGLFAGNGIKQETDNCRDFIGHLSATKKWKAVTLGGGVSYYNGSVYQGTQNVYSMNGKAFSLNDAEANKGKFAKREYMGLDAELVVKSTLGETKLHGEYLTGCQPGTEKSSKSPNASTLPVGDTWLRNFNGGYVMLVQSLGKSPLSLVAKYDWYDPNTKVAGNEVGVGTGTGAADLSQNTMGVGAICKLSKELRLTAYYDMNRNETSINLPATSKDLKNDLVTLRLQYKF